MGAAVESLPVRPPVLRSSTVRRPLKLQQGGVRLRVEPDGSVRSLFSMTEGRALFGFEQLSLFKLQAGIVVPAQRQDWGIRATPRSVHFAGRVFDGVEVSQTLEFHRGESPGYVRRLKLRNGSAAPVRLRAVELADPTAAHFEPLDVWGSLGVNAFNRDSHVAMDEVSDPPSARVVGSTPSPSKFYMTTSAARSADILAAGELPERTAGMSGQVIVLSSHEVDLAPGESREVTFASIYSAGKLEDALAQFGRLQSGEKVPPKASPLVATSDREMTEALAWALPDIAGGTYATSALDRYEVITPLSWLDPSAALKLTAVKPEVRKDGSLPHSRDRSKPGVLETSVLLRGASTLLLGRQDKKLARSRYPALRRLAGYLLSISKDFAVVTDPALPQGWRRHLGSGYPAGEVPEVSLAVAGALLAASQLGKMLSKSDDAAKFRERSEMISDRVMKKLVDERGFLALSLDSSGRLRPDDTVDMAVAAYRHPLKASVEQAVAHRLLEKDFDTPYGPRCVPTTNQVCFNSSYGMGQLGGVWPRAALAYASVCYRAGLSGVGSLAAGKVARLVTDDWARLGGSPGEFPQWVDPDSRLVSGAESDPVAAGRLLETIVEGELGLAVGADGPSLCPAQSSSIGWTLACDLWETEPYAAFVGRTGGKPHLFLGGKVGSKSGSKFAKYERLEVPARGVYGISFYSPGQVVCLGNGTASPVRMSVALAPRAADLSRRLSTPLEAFDAARGSWDKIGSLRVSTTMTFDASLDANGWKAFRISTA